MKKLLSTILLALLFSLRFATDFLPELTPLPPQHLPGPSIATPFLEDSLCGKWVDSIMSALSVEERLGQLFVYTISPRTTVRNRRLLANIIRDYHIGGLLFAKGRIIEQAQLTNEAQRLSKVPLLITCDGEWGLSMRLKDAPTFPKNLALGCIIDDSLMYEYGQEVARQCHEMGIHVNFAPVADVNINPKNPVINTRSFGENPTNVAKKMSLYARGLEDNNILSVCKHFPGHGDTETDSHKSLPKLNFSRERLDSIELYPFKKAIYEGLSGIMVGHLYVPALATEDSLPASLSHSISHDVLQERMKFNGLVFTDALNMKGVAGHDDLCLKALLAGNDILLVPSKFKPEMESLTKAIEKGILTEEFINEKCRKVLTYKYALGLHRRSTVRTAGLIRRINNKYSEALCQRLEYASITGLGNRDSLLPLSKEQDKIALLNVGSSKDIQPLVKELKRHATVELINLPPRASMHINRQVQEKLNRYPLVLVAINERKLSPYHAFFTEFAPTPPCVFLSFIHGPDLLQIYRGLSHAQATILAHSSGEHLMKRVAGVLYGEAQANGRLSASIGSLYAAGEGQYIGPGDEQDEELSRMGIDTRKLAEIDRIAEAGIQAGAYPSCQIAILKNGREIYNKSFGTRTGEAQAATVRNSDVYDLASLSKTTGTLLAVMKLYDQGRLSLSDKASHFLPFLQGTDKEDITIRELLFHESGLPATILFYRECIRPADRRVLFSGRKDATHTVHLGGSTYANPSFSFRDSLTSPVRTAQHTIQACDSLWLHESWKEEYLRLIAEARLGAKKYNYSCVGFIVLQQVVEAIASEPMDEFLDREFYRPLGLTHTGYRPLHFLSKEEIVPSAIDAFLRKSELCGYVHDESAAFQGGVSGNAGLFSNASETARIYQMILNGGIYNGRRFLSQSTCSLFTSETSSKSRRGLGFDRPDKRNARQSPCCQHAPESVFGHTGFTGTCAWADPDNRLVYVFLSNRLYPGLGNTKLSRLHIRTDIQECIYNSLR